MRSPAVRWTPFVIASSATIRPTPSPTPAAVKSVRAGRRSRFFRMRLAQVMQEIRFQTKPYDRQASSQQEERPEAGRARARHRPRPGRRRRAVATGERPAAPAAPAEVRDEVEDAPP